eukprot:13205773-Alexandrium_andersonii.AAC.1
MVVAGPRLAGRGKSCGRRYARPASRSAVEVFGLRRPARLTSRRAWASTSGLRGPGCRGLLAS